ncbi:uracil-DNA glycosylase [Peptacetobacter hominis]|uniref:Uracil-DNA glycosylase n=1 Tax=Peptacetobacter hominis TaxID=2743610 RepID=A0A544QYG5_9FIRM|nr:uracil-DNA glycosylase [Peptacetobacter hominis]TQQ85698.1 uracil-DNA glycosylase [Peptacetobacter hominis]
MDLKDKLTKEYWESMLSGTWKEILSTEFEKEYFKKLNLFLEDEYNNYEVFPKRERIFEAFNLTPFEDIKVVIIGQDPYHGDGQAHGLAFSVMPGIKTPPSLKNIYKELNSEYGCYIPDNGYLVKWAKQGVLMLNTSLTVRAHEANSHSKKGWEKFTDAAIKAISERRESVVFVLWGNNAKKKVKLIDSDKHMIIEGVHPSPLSASRGFFGCNHFRMINEFLQEKGYSEIDWQIENLQSKIDI